MNKLNEAGLNVDILGNIPTSTKTDNIQEQFANKLSKSKKTKKPKNQQAKDAVKQPKTKKATKKLKTQQVPIDKALIEPENKSQTIGQPSQLELLNNLSNGQSSIVVPKETESINDMMSNQLLNDVKQKMQQTKEQEQKEEKIEQAEKTIKKSGRKKKVIENAVNDKIQEAEAKGQVVTPQLRQQVMQEVAQNVSIEQITPDDYENVKEVLEEESNENLDNVNIPKLAGSIGEAFEEIPDADDIDLTDIQVTRTTKKTREGYYKVKVTIKKEGIPDIINKISSEVKKRTKGMIAPRVCDLRVIGNTNKTQLRNAKLKLSVNTIVFKPDAKRLKVNKGTRFMISIPEDFNSTGNLLVYIQESRDKTILEINTNELDDTVDFFASNISEYYYQGYNVTLKKLQRNTVNSPIMEVVNLIIANRGYKVKTYGDSDDNHIYMIDISSKDTETNEYICVRIKEGNQPGLWDVIAFDKRARDEYGLNQENKSINYLMQNILSILHKTYSMDWNKFIIDDTISSIKNGTMSGSDLQDAIENNDTEHIEKFLTTENEVKKLKHNKLKRVAQIFLSLMDKYGSDEYDAQLDLTFKCMSKQAMLKHSPENYDAEAIIGKTSACSFVLTYLAYPIKAGDKRRGRDYITTQEYYQKYNVRDRRQYQNREKTILRRQNEQRNYNARPYLFQLEYKINGSDTTYKYVSKSYQEIFDQTGILTLVPTGVNHVI